MSDEISFPRIWVVDTNGNIMTFGGSGGGDASATNQEDQITLETAIRDRLPNFSIPAFDSIVLSYVGSTNNFNNVIYELAGTTVATLTFTYVGGTPTANDALLLSVVRN